MEGFAAFLRFFDTLQESDLSSTPYTDTRLLIDGDWTEAALRLDRHNAEWPRDFAAIHVGHLIDFYRASARGLRDRILRVLPRWSEATPGRSVLLGMLLADALNRRIRLIGFYRTCIFVPYVASAAATVARSCSAPRSRP